MVTYVLAYTYCGLEYFDVYRNGIFQFQGTEEDIQDYLDLLGDTE